MYGFTTCREDASRRHRADAAAASPDHAGWKTALAFRLAMRAELYQRILESLEESRQPRRFGLGRKPGAVLHRDNTADGDSASSDGGASSLTWAARRSCTASCASKASSTMTPGDCIVRSSDRLIWSVPRWITVPAIRRTSASSASTPGWQLQPKIETLGVDRLDLPGPVRVVMAALCAGEPRHAAQGHGTALCGLAKGLGHCWWVRSKVRLRSGSSRVPSVASKPRGGPRRCGAGSGCAVATASVALDSGPAPDAAEFRWIA